MYDVAIIGAGFSGLAAGIRLAHFGKKVCIFERHTQIGGLNSYYQRQGREFEAGLHALTNFPTPGAKASSSPWLRVLRQLRILPAAFDLRPQIMSEIRFPGKNLKFTNDFHFFEEQVARHFPDQADRFRRFIRELPDYNSLPAADSHLSARQALAEAFSDPLLIEMLMCPVCFYGAATEDDMDLRQFIIMFRSIFLEGFSRPAGGVRALLGALLNEYKARGGELRLRSGIRRIHPAAQGPVTLITDAGEEIPAGAVLSSAGYPETLALCAGQEAATQSQSPISGAAGDRAINPDSAPDIAPQAATAQVLPGRLGYLEIICCLDVAPQDLGINSSIIFFSNSERFAYRQPQELIDLSSGVICCPDNFQTRNPEFETRNSEPETRNSELGMRQIRLSHLANYNLWKSLSPQEYQREKNNALHPALEAAVRHVPDFREHVTATDCFTPLTIERYTSRRGGAIYGSGVKSPQGLTPFPNVFLCGADQGLVGIVGAMLSGANMANAHVIFHGEFRP
ncbi:MAG: NAD(P)/FAD-dependent oxidoreductase [Candidatus Sumerlaeota bacterium]|nr:NAD(P)/FAD-dependent oxidoreductase [Candidatus Sumerlaeota bacterium]